MTGLTAAGLYFAIPQGSRSSSDSDMLQLADFAYQEKRYTDAFEWYQTAANQGLSLGQLRLSQMYQLGEGVDKDEEQAAHWMKLAAEQGLAQAQFEYGEILESGRGVERTGTADAASWYIQSSNQGNPKAMLKLAKLYFGGLGVKQDTYQAFKWALKAEENSIAGSTELRQQIMEQINNTAAKGVVYAQYMMAIIYLEGQGIEKDINQAELWLRKAASQGYPDAQYDLGKMLVTMNDTSSGLYWLRLAAKQGHIEAGYHIAPLLTSNHPDESALKESWRWLYHGMKNNDPKSLYNLTISLHTGSLRLPKTDFNYLKWLIPSARGKISEAQNNLGVHLKLNKKDTKRSIQWLKEASTNSDKAQFNLGFIYARGEGIAPHDEQAVYWWNQAEKNGNEQASFMLGLFYNLGRGARRNEQEAIKWYELAAKKDNPTAIYNLAILYYQGKAVDQDYKKAARYLSILAKKGDGQAQNLYASLFLEGHGVDYSPATAVKWFQEAATANNVKAMFNLAGAYRSGNGITQNDEKAFYWYQKAAELNFAPAQNAMGYMFAEGRGTKMDKDIAEVWFQKASANGLDLAKDNASALNKRGSFSLIRIQLDTEIRSDILTSKNIKLEDWLETHQTLVF